MKKKRLAITFGGILLVIAGLMLSVLFLPSNAITAQASTSDKYYEGSFAGISPLAGPLPDSGTFVSFRAGLSGRNSHLEFLSKEFQHNRQNFMYTGGYVIANLINARHDKTLLYQNRAIRNRANISSAVGLTVFASGQGGDATQWTGEDLVRVGGFYVNHAYIDYNSLLEQLRQQSGGNVYIARTDFFNFTINAFPLNVHVNRSDVRFALQRLNIGMNGRYIREPVDHITDFTRHNIIYGTPYAELVAITITYTTNLMPYLRKYYTITFTI